MAETHLILKVFIMSLAGKLHANVNLKMKKKNLVLPKVFSMTVLVVKNPY